MLRRLLVVVIAPNEAAAFRFDDGRVLEVRFIENIGDLPALIGRRRFDALVLHSASIAVGFRYSMRIEGGGFSQRSRNVPRRHDRVRPGVAGQYRVGLNPNPRPWRVLPDLLIRGIGDTINGARAELVVIEERVPFGRRSDADHRMT